VLTSKQRGLGFRLSATALILLALVGTQLVGASGSSASTVTNPALAKTSQGRFLSTIVLDGGVITVTPAPSNVSPTRGVPAMTAKIWASAQLAGFAHQTLGYGYVTVSGAASGETPMNHLLAWVGFANGNTSNVCAKDKAGKFRTNGEAAVVLGDAGTSQAVSYVAPGCGIAQRSGYRIPAEVLSVPWVQVGTADSNGQINFRTSSAQCGAVYGSTKVRTKGVVEVFLYSQKPDWSAHSCTASVQTLGMALAKNASKANVLRLVHGSTGPVRQVVNG
jgi:hypothetical protein